jgi:hypothetical protein
VGPTGSQDGPSIAQIQDAIRTHGSIRAAARALGRDESSFRRALTRHQARGHNEAETPKTDITGDTATFTTPASLALTDLPELMRERGLDPADWLVVYATVNSWEALASGGGEDGEPTVVTLHQLKATLKRKLALSLVTPAVHVPALAKANGPKFQQRASRVAVIEPDVIVVEGDHQVPYHDPQVHQASLRMLAEIRPVEHILLGDTLDFPTISKHQDHPAAMAAVQRCVDEGYRLLRDKAEASPNSRRRKLKGNHDWRLEGELLSRAERMYGIRPAGENEPALSLRRLLHLEALRIELVEHPLGWEHAEIELVPGRDGLVVRHGIVTGQNVAKKTLAKLGRSAIVGHAHSKESAWHRNSVTGHLSRCDVAGVMCRIDDVFPHFTAGPADWHQGFVTVTRWPDGRFTVEHATYNQGVLGWRDRRWDAA